MHSNTLVGNIIINMLHVIIIMGILCHCEEVNEFNFTALLILQHYNTQNYKAISQFYKQ